MTEKRGRITTQDIDDARARNREIMRDRPLFYEVVLAPTGRMASLEMLDNENIRFNANPGPFARPHLACGYQAHSGSGIPREFPPLRVIYKHRVRGPSIRDFDHLGECWIVTDRARELIERIAPGGVDCMPAQVFVRRDGIDEPAGLFWHCDVIRMEDAVDEDASFIRRQSGGFYDIVSSFFILKRDLPPDLHLFRLWHGPHIILCSEVFRQAVLAAKLLGMEFRRADQ